MVLNLYLFAMRKDLGLISSWMHSGSLILYEVALFQEDEDVSRLGLMKEGTSCVWVTRRIQQV